MFGICDFTIKVDTGGKFPVNFAITISSRPAEKALMRDLILQNVRPIILQLDWDTPLNETFDFRIDNSKIVAILLVIKLDWEPEPSNTLIMCALPLISYAIIIAVDSIISFHLLTSAFLVLLTLASFLLHRRVD